MTLEDQKGITSMNCPEKISVTFYTSEWVTIILYVLYLQVRKSPIKRNFYCHPQISVSYLNPKSRTISILNIYNQLLMKAEQCVLNISKNCANDMAVFFAVEKIDSQMHLKSLSKFMLELAGFEESLSPGCHSSNHQLPL